MIHDAGPPVDSDDHRLFVAGRIADHQRSHIRRIVRAIGRVVVGFRDRRVFGHRPEGRSEKAPVAVRLRRALELSSDGGTLIVIFPCSVLSQVLAQVRIGRFGVGPHDQHPVRTALEPCEHDLSQIVRNRGIVGQVNDILSIDRVFHISVYIGAGARARGLHLRAGSLRERESPDDYRAGGRKVFRIVQYLSQRQPACRRGIVRSERAHFRHRQHSDEALAVFLRTLLPYRDIQRPTSGCHP